MNLLFKKIEKTAKIYDRAHETDAGYDICSLESVTLEPGVPMKCRTGIAVVVPPQHVGLLWDKSSIGARGIKTLGGVIDSGFRGEIVVILVNCTKEPIDIAAGQKITQLLVQKHESWNLEEVDELPPADRGDQGFGSTGK